MLNASERFHIYKLRNATFTDSRNPIFDIIIKTNPPPTTTHHRTEHGVDIQQHK
jgi:hypothetical protein